MIQLTRDEAIHELCQAALGEVGYHEGANNFNKYAADPRLKQLYGWDVQNQPWCCVFVNWLFINVFGYDDGTAMTYGGSAGCAVFAGLYKNNNAWSLNPRKGDQIFFYSGGGINHTGLVVDVSGSTITTAEGNYGDSVSKNTYFTGDPSIAGYGVPNWSIAANLPDDDDEPTDDKTGLVVDGECGENTWAALAKKMPLLKKGSKGNAVKALQAALNFLGAELDVDGDFGVLTEKEVREFQEGKL